MNESHENAKILFLTALLVMSVLATIASLGVGDAFISTVLYSVSLVISVISFANMIILYFRFKKFGPKA